MAVVAAILSTFALQISDLDKKYQKDLFKLL